MIKRLQVSEPFMRTFSCLVSCSRWARFSSDSPAMRVTSDSYRRKYIVKWGNELGPTAMLLGAALQADHGYLLRDSSSSRISGKDVIGIRTPKGWRGEADSRYEMLCTAGILILLPLPGGGDEFTCPRPVTNRWRGISTSSMCVPPLIQGFA